jgi:hypothetical protein
VSNQGPEQWQPSQLPATTPIPPSVSQPFVRGGVLQVPHVMTVPVARHSTVAHIIHGVVALLTLGAWLPGWITYAITARRRTLRVTIDQSGMLTATYD